MSREGTSSRSIFGSTSERIRPQQQCNRSSEVGRRGWTQSEMEVSRFVWVWRSDRESFNRRTGKTKRPKKSEAQTERASAQTVKGPPSSPRRLHLRLHLSSLSSSLRADPFACASIDRSARGLQAFVAVSGTNFDGGYGSSSNGLFWINELQFLCFDIHDRTSEMKKQKESVIDPTSGSDGGLDLKSVIHQHSLFFDKLIELIPAKFYLPNDDKERPWFHGLSKAQKESAKKESRENIKKARRDRLDPQKSSATTVDLLMQSLEKEKEDYGSDREDAVDTKLTVSGKEGKERKVTYEELQQRLRNKIEQLRAARITTNPDKIKRKTEEVEQGKKRKRDTEVKPSTSDGGDRKVNKDIEEASKELAFSQVKLGNKEERAKKRKKLSKEKELERARKLKEVKKDPVKGEVVSKKHSWKAATSRAAGIKVHDDPKLLKQSIQKEKKRHQKNAEKWKERAGTQQKGKAEKQQKRSENIAERAREKKQRKIAKREKKLLRPGFEGRKVGFINESLASA
ncbi:hypothetical protein CDL15_Pgr004598 [Punica granatum]|uniref:Ribosomal RNA-processing protein 14/surfeit locus protein 6 C-terminal domain-containing protein n=1 Tax=Punica granatum TaxID=22663 RepID=A0A218WRI2_PUNGR|nr:hypothetical protein CDL15_Pgr004598 [Punica granatum]